MAEFFTAEVINLFGFVFFNYTFNYYSIDKINAKKYIIVELMCCEITVFLFKCYLIADLQKPIFTSCPSEDIVKVAQKKKDKAIVSWPIIKATDNDGFVPKLTVFPSNIPSKATSFEFSEGKHSIVYTATDSSGNFAQCSFYITVKGNSI